MKTKLAFSLSTVILDVSTAIVPMSFALIRGPMDIPMHGNSSAMRTGKDDSMKDMDHDKVNMDSDEKDMDHDKVNVDSDRRGMDHDKMNMGHDKMSMDSDKKDMNHGKADTKDTDKGETQAL